jgi:hypothetical protein
METPAKRYKSTSGSSSIEAEGYSADELKGIIKTELIWAIIRTAALRMVGWAVTILGTAAGAHFLS